jgi:hypothetical protein
VDHARAIVATLLWLIASLAFKFYVSTFADYEGSYGAVGGIITLLLWLYISGLGVLIGAELNAELEHAMPYGEKPLTDTESGRRVIGARAARLFERLQAAATANAPPVTAVSDEGRTRWSMLPGLAFTTTVLALRGPRRVLRGPS